MDHVIGAVPPVEVSEAKYGWPRLAPGHVFMVTTSGTTAPLMTSALLALTAPGSVPKATATAR
jgi:hypothetical protein